MRTLHLVNSYRFTLSEWRFNTSKRTPVYLLLLFLSQFVTAQTFASAGELDFSFGKRGLVTTDVGGDYNDGTVNKVFYQADGKILVAAYAGANKLLRLHPDGRRDVTFGDDGELTLNNPTISDFEWVIGPILPQPDGKILIAGYIRALSDSSCLGATCNDAYSIDFLLARFNRDGSLDTSFGIDGKVISDFSHLYSTQTNDYLDFIALKRDGSIIGVGRNHLIEADPREEHTIIVHYGQDGIPDSSFGTDGVIEFGVSLDRSTVKPGYLSVQSDDKFVVGAQKRYDSVITDYLVRYDTNGAIDATFGSDGSIEPLPAGDIILANDGKFLLAGYASETTPTGNTCGFGIYRINEDGSPDLSFGNDGLVISDFGCSGFRDPWPHHTSRPHQVIIKPDGKVIALGYRVTQLSQGGRSLYDLAIAQYKPDGSPDMSFGEDGKLVFEFDSRQSMPASVLVRLNGSLLVFANLTTYEIDPNRYPYRNPILLGFTDSGELDTKFGDGGKITLPVHWVSDDQAKDIAVAQADGKIVVAGDSSRIFDKNDFAITRYNRNGRIDETFGNGGSITTDFTFEHDQPCDSVLLYEDTLSSIAMQPDGKILAVGTTYGSMNDKGCVTSGHAIAIARYHPNGDLDEDFGNGGKLVVYGEDHDCAEARDVLVQSDGKIVLAGVMCGKGYLVARLNQDGSYDQSFGTDGLFSLNPFDQQDFRYGLVLTDIVQQDDGKFVALGEFTCQFPLWCVSLDRWNALRINNNGTLDYTFNPGVGFVNVYTGNYPHGGALAVQADGSVLVSGSTKTKSPERHGWTTFTTTRYLPDGSLDSSFGTEGVVQTDFDRLFGDITGSKPNSIALQPDGRIIVAGSVHCCYEFGTDNSDFALLRYHSDGRLDYSFGYAGLVTTEFGSKVDEGVAVTLQRNGDILLVGNSSQYSKGLGYQFAVARYEGGSTRVDELEGLVLRVQELQWSDILNEGQAQALQMKLRKAMRKLRHHRYVSAIKQLQAFMNHVESFLSEGILSTDQGNILTTEAQMILDLLSAECPSGLYGENRVGDFSTSGKLEEADERGGKHCKN